MGAVADAKEAAPPVRLEVLRHRRDFLAAARARRASRPAFTLQARHRAPDEAKADAVRVGFTCSRRLGNAVARNRAKRRLRALARLVLPAHGRAGWDYVLVGRAVETATRRFDSMVEELERALGALHAGRRAG